MNPKNIVVHEGTLILKGFTRFAFYAQKDGRAITDGYSVNFLACTAALIFSNNQNFVLNTKEFIPDGTQMEKPVPLTTPRRIKLTPSVRR